jgi:hypothetical protein
LPEVEMRRRLVEEKKPGILCHERCECEAPPFAAGQRSRIARVETCEPECCERRARALDVGGRLPLPAREVRMTSDERRLEHRGRKVIDALLRRNPRIFARSRGRARQSALPS